MKTLIVSFLVIFCLLTALLGCGSVSIKNCQTFCGDTRTELYRTSELECRCK